MKEESQLALNNLALKNNTKTNKRVKRIHADEQNKK